MCVNFFFLLARVKYLSLEFQSISQHYFQDGYLLLLNNKSIEYILVMDRLLCYIALPTTILGATESFMIRLISVHEIMTKALILMNSHGAINRSNSGKFINCSESEFCLISNCQQKNLVERKRKQILPLFSSSGRIKQLNKI